MKNKYYTKYEIKNNKFYKVAVQETVECEIEITSPSVAVKLLATGAYGQIKFLYANEEFVCDRIFERHYITNKVINSTEKTDIIATNNFGTTPTKAINMKNVTFTNLSPKEMADLHDRYIKEYNGSYWLNVQ
jgi:hypothetical protein